MLAGRAFEIGNLQHSHDDGSWHDMEQVESEAATEDPERGWVRGTIYQCRTCTEQIRVVDKVDIETPTELLTTPDLA